MPYSKGSLWRLLKCRIIRQIVAVINNRHIKTAALYKFFLVIYENKEQKFTLCSWSNIQRTKSIKKIKRMNRQTITKNYQVITKKLLDNLCKTLDRLHKPLSGLHRLVESCASLDDFHIPLDDLCKMLYRLHKPLGDLHRLLESCGSLDDFLIPLDNLHVPLDSPPNG